MPRRSHFNAGHCQLIPEMCFEYLSVLTACCLVQEVKLWDAGEVSGSSLTSIGNPIPSSKYGKLTIELFTTTFVNR